jgi:16S rRNA (guanine966-N2)-methyltransferase
VVRISGGDARGLRLVVPKGSRPASEKVRQAVFASIASHVPDARVLDLFSGSGAYGLEALSRGASEAVFVDKDLAATKACRTNVCAIGVQDSSRIRRTDVLRYLRRNASKDGPFDLIFIDPPYDDPLERVLTEVGAFLADEGRIVVEMRSKGSEPVRHPGLVVEADRRYGDTRVLMLSRTGEVG